MLFVDDQIEMWIVILVVLGVLLLGALLFMATGFIIISKNRVGIIEKMGKYIGTYKSGLYYYLPLMVRRVGYYHIGETKQKVRVNAKNYIVRYEIENFKTFHYEGNHDVLGIVTSCLNAKTDDLSKLLIERFNQVGARFISLEIIKRR